MSPLHAPARRVSPCLVLVAVIVLSSLSAFAKEGGTPPESDGVLADVGYSSFSYLPFVERSVLDIGEKYPADNREYELELLRLINQARLSAGVAPATENDNLTQAARRHSEDMAVNGWLSHTGTDGSTPGERMVQEGYAGIGWGEAIGYNASSAQSMFDWWMSSTPHRAILLDPLVREMGFGYSYNTMGRYNTYWVVDTGH